MKRKKRIAALALLLGVIIVAVWLGNNALGITKYEVVANIPYSFDRFKIAHISDLHNANIGNGNKKVLDALCEISPDIIVMTGDMIDSRNTKVEVAADFAQKATEIAPCYYVTGNHEARVRGEYEKLKKALVAAGVKVLENESVVIKRGNDEISLTGIHDTGFDFDTGVEYLIKGAIDNSDNYRILLMHRPEYFKRVEGADLVLSGHAHGGQIRLPFVGGLFAPGQGLLPEFDAGVYKNGETVMVVSRGLGNSLFPIRVNNPPEIVEITLRKE